MSAFLGKEACKILESGEFDYPKPKHAASSMNSVYKRIQHSINSSSASGSGSSTKNSVSSSNYTVVCTVHDNTISMEIVNNYLICHCMN